MNLDDCPDLLRVEEAAGVLRVSRNRVYEEIALFSRTSGREGLPAVRIGRVLRVPKESLQDWIRAQVTPDEAAGATRRSAAGRSALRSV